MKRNFALAIVVALTLIFGIAVTASAQDATAIPPNPAGTCANGNWVDSNNDGMCDNASRDSSGMQYGRRSSQGQGSGSSSGFVDENGDGLCDNFIDADGDGRCDNCSGTQGGPRRGAGQRMHGGYGMHADRGMQSQP
jgi:hypothetical protein